LNPREIAAIRATGLHGLWIVSLRILAMRLDLAERALHNAALDFPTFHRSFVCT
jgi:hypothetical protein